MRNPGNRWELIWSHRDELLELARRGSSSTEDAEDAVQEAMIRAVEDRSVQYGRVGPWLRAVTVRLCADRHRQVARDVELSTRPSLASTPPVPVEDVVCDRAEARWLVDRSAELLPAHQAEALRLRSQGFDVGDVALNLGLSYRATESLLARARQAVRGMVAGVLSLAATVWLFTRRLPGTGVTQSAAATSTAVTVAVMGLALPAGSPGLADGQRPASIRAASPSRAAPDAAYPAPRETREASARSLSSDPHRVDQQRADRAGQDTQRPASENPLGAAAATATTAVRSDAVAPVLRQAVTAVPSLPTDAARARSTSAPTVPTGTTAPTSPAVPALGAATGPVDLVSAP